MKCLYCGTKNKKDFWDDDNQVCVKCRGFGKLKVPKLNKK